MRYYCTYFDHNYLLKGLALYRSLARHSSGFRIWVLCLSDECYEELERLKLPGMELIRLDEFERGDDGLLAAKQNRSRTEYYFTCTPSLPLYLFRHRAEIDSITYLDADLYFFDDPELAHEQVGDYSIGITPHRFSPENQGIESYSGRFNVGWVTFRRDDLAMACLQWWREQCLEWCYDRCEPTRFGDQKYLDVWPTKFEKVKIIEHPGINLALWNVSQYTLQARDQKVSVDGWPLVVYHFHFLSQVNRYVFDPHWLVYQVVPTRELIDDIYGRYLNELRGLPRMLKLSNSVAESCRGSKQPITPKDGYLRYLYQQLRVAGNISAGRHILATRSRILGFKRRDWVLKPASQFLGLFRPKVDLEI